MKNIIVGTAGHVDHGKTCLIKALTGIDTDRLKEEKKRGITIDLGFASLGNSEDMRIGIIDVPGHERFIRNMLAGIGGIDMVLFVVGLDEGVMPQTIEHFEILKSIGIGHGIIVYTKADIADPEMVSIIDEDVNDMVMGSFLENAPRVEVSSYTGLNIDLLRDLILGCAKNLGTRRMEKELFRLPIDRVFSMKGFGTVVTGTLLEGSIDVGDEIEVYPIGKKVRIRQIQSHGTCLDHADAGQRTALNLSGMGKEELSRGEVLAFPGSIIPSSRLDVRLELFKSNKRKLRNGDRIHVNYGSKQAICRVYSIDGDFWQLAFDSPVAVRRNDRIIIRFFSPVETFGGGVVLRVDAPKLRSCRFSRAEYTEVLRRLHGSNDRIAVETELEMYGELPVQSNMLAVKLNIPESDVREILEKLHKTGIAMRLKSMDSVAYVHKHNWKMIVSKAESALEHFHGDNPLAPGMPVEKFKQMVGIGDMILDGLVEREKVVVRGTVASKPGFSASYSKGEMLLRDEIESKFLGAGIMFPDVQAMADSCDDPKKARQMVLNLQKDGRLVKIAHDAYMHVECYHKTMAMIGEHFRSNGTLTLSQFRDMTKSSRKYALLFLDFCDRKGFTKLQGESRIPLKFR